MNTLNADESSRFPENRRGGDVADDEARFLDFWAEIRGSQRLGPASAKYSRLADKWYAICELANDRVVSVAPSFLEIHLTEGCHNDCLFCREGLREVPTEEQILDPEVANQVLADLAKLNPGAFVRFSGTIGDPLHYPYASQVFASVNRCNLRWGLVTNGLGLSGDRLIKELLSADYVNISVDAGSNETYVKLKQPRRPQPRPYDTVMGHAANLAEQRRKRNSSTKIIISMLLQRDNYREVMTCATRARAIGADQFQIKMQHVDVRRSMSVAEVKAAYSEVQSARRLQTAEFNVIAIQTLSEALAMLARTVGIVPLGTLRSGGPAGPVQMIEFSKCFANALGLSGTLVPSASVETCCQTYQNILPSHGTVANANPFAAIWEGERRADSLRQDPRQYCVSCSPSDLFVNTFLQFLTDAQRRDPTFLQRMGSKYVDAE